MATNEAVYMFRGHRFLDYVDIDKLKSDLGSAYEIPKEIKDYNFPEYYSYLIQNFPHNTVELRKIFFENILYSHLKHIYVNKISGHPDLELESFKQKIKKIIEINNKKENIPFSYQKFMSEEGFYLMDLMNISKLGTTFIAGLDYETKRDYVVNARFLFVEVVPQGIDKRVYFIAGVELDFENNLALTMIKNVNGLKKEDETDDTEIDTTVPQLNSRVTQKIFNTLGVSLESPIIKDDRAGMYKFCKQLDDNLLTNVRREVNYRTDKTVKNSVRNLNRALFNKDKSLSRTDKEDLGKKVQALLLSYFIEHNYEPRDLVRKAKKKKLVGYPTRIKFTSNKSSRSSTQSSNAKFPVSASDMFHSLYFNFEQALGLDNWSISWFTDFTFTNEKNIDVIQTTIHSTTKYFKVVFLPTRPLDKEIINYVIRTINSYR